MVRIARLFGFCLVLLILLPEGLAQQAYGKGSYGVSGYSGGGGGGSSRASDVYKYTSQILRNLRAGDEGVFSFMGPFSIRAVNIRVRRDLYSPRVEIEKIKPTHGLNAIPRPEGVVYDYELVKSGFGDDFVDGVTIAFRIRSDWLKKNNLTSRDVLLKVYEGEWVDLDTVFIRESQGYSYFEAYSSKLGSFAISAVRRSENKAGRAMPASGPQDDLKEEVSGSTVASFKEPELADFGAYEPLRVDELSEEHSALDNLLIVMILLFSVCAISVGVYRIKRRSAGS
ncbi:PGF-pre-PGF domain-containing protein [Candidatus Woesearchaeota archaeon]|nr:MAG: PGF-pre-PGF domain-containing protein [Candidatus Woesearchaeota archaeon]